MFARPADLAEADVVDGMFDGWGLRVADVEYAPVGFGSYHWHVRSGSARWFVSVDDLDARHRDRTQTRKDTYARLAAALTVARALRDEGLTFVVAPEISLSGTVLQRLTDRYVAAVYPHVDGTPHLWGRYPRRRDRIAAVHLLADLHDIDPHRVGSGLRDDFSVPGHDELMTVLADPLSVSWGPGPFSDRTRDLLGEHDDALRAVVARYGDLQRHVEQRSPRLVITHGEPHYGNIIDTATGPVLIDWDTALVAPAERDLWSLAEEDPSVAGVYERRTGQVLDRVTMRMYRLWWDLCEISLFVADLHGPHEDNDDTATAWQKLSFYLDPSRWAAELNLTVQ